MHSIWDSAQAGVDSGEKDCGIVSERLKRRPQGSRRKAEAGFSRTQAAKLFESRIEDLRDKSKRSWQIVPAASFG